MRPPDVLETILADKRRRVEILRASADFALLREQALLSRGERGPHRLFRSLSDADHTNIIAEYKRASPSKGVINDAIRPAEAASMYLAGGAAAISVLTEEDHFLGSLDDLEEIRRAVTLPLLRKDFIVDEIQITEAAAAGADAVLLIAAALSDRELGRFLQQSADFGLDALVEVHDLDELWRAYGAGAKLVGVNNRNLRTFEVSLDVSRELVTRKDPGTLMISESGISSRDEIAELKTLGFDGFLIGETLMRSTDPVTELRRLSSDEEVLARK